MAKAAVEHLIGGGLALVRAASGGEIRDVRWSELADQRWRSVDRDADTRRGIEGMIEDSLQPLVVDVGDARQHVGRRQIAWDNVVAFAASMSGGVATVPGVDEAAVAHPERFDAAQFATAIDAEGDVPDRDDMSSTATTTSCMKVRQLVLFAADALDLLLVAQQCDAVGIVAHKGIGADFGNQLGPLVPDHVPMQLYEPARNRT